MRDEPILIVDDDSSIRETVSDLLDIVGYHVIVAADGVEALSMIEGSFAPAGAPPLMLIMDGWVSHGQQPSGQSRFRCS
jgi:CheY-like chemotaxis protein